MNKANMSKGQVSELLKELSREVELKDGSFMRIVAADNFEVLSNTIAVYEPYNGQTYRIVRKDSREWTYMWCELSKHKLNASFSDSQICLNNGKSWIYAGTDLVKGGLFHKFNHKCHPKNEKEMFVNIPVSKNYDPVTDAYWR